MRFTCGAILGLVCCGVVGCADTETMLSVNVRYWTDYLDPETFSLTIEQTGQTSVRDADFVPAKLAQGDAKDGRFGYDVLCEDGWRLKQDESVGATYGNYCRFFKRYSLAGWAAADVRVTFAAKTRTGETFEPPRDSGGSPRDATQQRFELEPHEVNVVYFEFEDSMLPGSVVPAGDSGSGDAAPASDGSVADAEVAHAGGAASSREPSDGAVTASNPAPHEAGSGAQGDAAVPSVEAGAAGTSVGAPASDAGMARDAATPPLSDAAVVTPDATP